MSIQRHANGKVVGGSGKSLRIVLGIPELDRKLRSLPAKLEKKVVRQALREALKPLLAATRQAAPQGLTGQLRRAVRLRAAKRTRKGNIRFIVQIGAGFFVGKTFYGSFVELGTKYIEARHFMTRVYESHKEAAKQDAIARIKSGVDSAIASL